jgi:hypothetical protein
MKRLNSIFSKERFSNVDIFEKRFKERKKLFSAGKKKINSVCLNKTNQFNSTLSTSPTTRRSIFSSNKLTKTKQFIGTNNNQFYLKSNTNNNNLYITESSFLKSSKSTKKLCSSPIYDLNSFSEKNYSSEKNNSLNLTIEKNFGFNIKLLRNFEKEKKNLFNLKKKSKLDFKMNQFNKIRDNKIEFINKTREKILLNYTINLNKERVETLREEYNNKIIEINKGIKLAKSAFDITKNKFFNKFSEYVRFLKKKNKIEKLKNNNLMEEIMKLKTENLAIEKKIKNIEHTKNNILRWIYLQILINEKILTIPEYYKEIIENSDKYLENLINKKNQKEITMSSKVPSPKREKKFPKSPKKKTIQIFSLHFKKEFEKFELNKKYNELEKNDTNEIIRNISIKEIERIRDYKYKIKFLNLNDIYEKFNEFENENLNYIIKYNDINLDLKDLKKEYKSLLMERKIENEFMSDIIEKKISELKLLKTKHENLTNEISYLKNKINKRNLSNKNELCFNSFLEDNENKLYSYIYNLYSNCCLLNIKYIEKIDEKSIKELSQEESIIYYLKRIELYIDFLIIKFHIYKNKKGFYYNQYKEILNEIEKEKKIYKAKIQKEIDIQRIEKLKFQMEIRNNKIYFLPKKKYEKFNNIEVKKEKKEKKDQQIEDKIDFNDYMYD